METDKGEESSSFQNSTMVARNDNYSGIEMEDYWKLIESHVMPIITYSGTNWNPNKKETKVTPNFNILTWKFGLSK